MSSSELTIQQKFYKFMNEMDFKSQDNALKLLRIIMVLTAIVSLILSQISYGIAYMQQRFSICIYSILIAMGVMTIVIMPAGWPWWKQPSRQFAKLKKE